MSSSPIGGSAAASSLWNNPQLLSALLPGFNLPSLQQAMQAGITVDELPLNALAQQLNGLQSQWTAWNRLQGDLTTINTDATTLGGTALYQGITAASTQTAAVTATASAGASGTPGTYQVNVVSLMKIEIDNSAAAASSTAALNYSGSFSVNGTAVTVATGDTLTSIAQSINKAAAGVTATVLPSGGSFVLNLASTQGTAITWSDPNAILSGLGIESSGTPLNPVQTAAQASYTINGVAETSATNSDSASIPGVTLNFLTPTTTPALVTVAQNQAGVTGAFSQLATDYNALLSDLGKYSGKGGVLEGNAALLGIASGLQRSLTTVSATQPSGYQSLAQLGVTLTAPVGSPDQLALGVNATTLQTALTNNPAAVTQLMSATGTGIANLLQQQLGAYVGPTGSITAEVTSLQTQISNLGTQINDPNSSVNLRLTQQNQALQTEFQHMLTALLASQVQGQQMQGFLQAQYGTAQQGTGGIGLA